MYIFPAFHFSVLESAVSSAVLGHYIPSDLGNGCIREVCKLVDKDLLQDGSVWTRATLPLRVEHLKCCMGEGAQGSGAISVLGDF